MFVLQNYMQGKIRAFCEETGHCCHEWVDRNSLKALQMIDQNNKTKFAQEYLEKCHTLDIVIKPPKNGNLEWEFSLKCCPNDIAGIKQCSYQNDKALEKFKEDFLSRCT